MNERCETCKWWERHLRSVGDGTWGYCRRAEVEGAGLYVYVNDQGDGSELSTRSDFGCVEHATKDAR